MADLVAESVVAEPLLMLGGTGAPAGPGDLLVVAADVGCGLVGERPAAAVAGGVEGAVMVLPTATTPAGVVVLVDGAADDLGGAEFLARVAAEDEAGGARDRKPTPRSRAVSPKTSNSLARSSPKWQESTAP